MKTVVNRPITPKISKITNQYKNIFVIKFVSNTIKIAKTALVEICVKKTQTSGISVTLQETMSLAASSQFTPSASLYNSRGTSLHHPANLLTAAKGQLPLPLRVAMPIYWMNTWD